MSDFPIRKSYGILFGIITEKSEFSIVKWTNERFSNKKIVRYIFRYNYGKMMVQKSQFSIVKYTNERFSNKKMEGIFFGTITEKSQFSIVN